MQSLLKNWNKHKKKKLLKMLRKQQISLGLLGLMRMVIMVNKLILITLNQTLIILNQKLITINQIQKTPCQMLKGTLKILQITRVQILKIKVDKVVRPQIKLQIHQTTTKIAQTPLIHLIVKNQIVVHGEV
jgi:hypothetical protein